MMAGVMSAILTKNLRAKIRSALMKGLCQKCHSSNVEIAVIEGIPVCETCVKKAE